jgi:nucleoside-diphosphate-sugar epimerase
VVTIFQNKKEVVQTVVKILVTGALGQIGTELVQHLRNCYGIDNVVATSRKIKKGNNILEEGIFEILDVTDSKNMANIVNKYKITIIYHLASILSAKGEKEPQSLWAINIGGLINVLEVARNYNCSIFFPSSIAVFGAGSPSIKTPQDSVTRPSTIYGVSKVSGEMLCDYYHFKYDMDIRGLRFPGIVSNVTLPGGGTTDYAVEIYYEAVKRRGYNCFLREDSSLDMIYMPDVLNGIVQLMEADPKRLSYRNAYNVTAMSTTPKQIFEEIRKHIPCFEMSYNVDPIRQAIADGWPDSLDDTVARKDWGWNPQFDLSLMTKDMIEVLSRRSNVLSS